MFNKLAKVSRLNAGSYETAAIEGFFSEITKALGLFEKKVIQIQCVVCI